MIKFVLLLNLLYYVLMLAVLILFGIRFYQSVISKGLERTKQFTLTVLAVSALFTLLAWVWFNMAAVLPIRIIFYSRHSLPEIILMTGLLIIYILAFLLIKKSKTVWWMVIVWTIIGLVNLISTSKYLHAFITWKDPATDKNPTGLSAMISAFNYIPRENYLVFMLRPLCWVAVSAVSLRKIWKARDL